MILFRGKEALLWRRRSFPTVLPQPILPINLGSYDHTLRRGHLLKQGRCKLLRIFICEDNHKMLRSLLGLKQEQPTYKEMLQAKELLSNQSRSLAQNHSHQAQKAL
jgi:hypothetical protein